MSQPLEPIFVLSAGEAEALLALGRLDGALRVSDSTPLRLFAARLLRTTLTTALRQEGHAFTDTRFHAWFAGVVTLSDQSPREACPPRMLVSALLIELAHSPWEPLAELATQFASALMAPRDYIGAAAESETVHEQTHELLAAARALIERLAPCPLPLPALVNLHQALGDHILFASEEPASETIAFGPLRMTADRSTRASPRWAVETLWGEHWYKAGLLAHALPFPNLIRLEATCTDTDSAHSQLIIANALRDSARGLYKSLGEMHDLARSIDKLEPGRRRTSRAPALIKLLASYGPLRSAQIETLLGATRLGVRSMISSLGDLGILERTTLAGVHLYSVDLTNDTRADTPAPTPFSLSASALDEFNSSMANIDALLSRLRHAAEPRHTADDC